MSKNNDFKKDKAIKLFLSGMKKGTICKKLHLNIQLLNKWTNYDSFKIYRKKAALKMNSKRIPKDIICRKLNIPYQLLNKWINEYLNDYRKTNFDIRQDGYSAWVSNILDYKTKKYQKTF